MGKKIDISKLEVATGSAYPPRFAAACANRQRRRLGDAAGLNDFGVNVLRLPPGAWSSQRHWHTHEDEFVYVLEGVATLVTDAGEEELHAGDCAGFRAGEPDGHHIQNRSAADVVVLEVGARKRADDRADYPDIDLRSLENKAGYVHKDGTPYSR